MPFRLTDARCPMDRPDIPNATEAALRESEARYRGLFGSLPDGVILRGADGRVLACNEQAARVWC